MLLLALFACSKEPVGTTEDPPTWYADVAPMVSASCLGCHSAGGVAPFSLETPEEAAVWAQAMVTAVDAGRMPPWSAESTETCAPRHGWKNDIRLSDEQKATLRAWADAGAPAGDPALAEPISERQSLDLEPIDLEVLPAVGYAPSGTKDEFVCYSMDPGFTQTKWLTGFQIQPGVPRAVHHVLVFADPEGESARLANEDGYYPCFGGVGLSNTTLVGAWAPGSVPLEMPAGVAEEITAGSRLVMQVHYHPNGDTHPPDRTGVAMRFADTAPDKLTQLILLGNFDTAPQLLAGPNDRSGAEFRIPANVKDHTEEMQFKYRGGADAPVWMVGTHMHYIGSGMSISVEHREPQGDEPTDECLIETPRWDFNWQRAYQYDAALADVPQVRRGDTLRLTCTYDNTVDNPGVRQALSDAGVDAPVDVTLGETTLDEMCLGVFGMILDR